MNRNNQSVKLLVTGCNGFVGTYMAKAGLDKGFRVAGLDRAQETGIVGMKYYSADILDKESIEKVFWDYFPTHIIHLAAVTYVPDSFKNIDYTFQVNLQGTLNILTALEVVMTNNTFSRLLYVSSSEVYNLGDDSEMYKETDIPCPANPYAISKLSGEYLCDFFHRSRNIPITIVRPFNHTGPGQMEKFVCSDFARQIALIEKGEKEPVISVGNLKHARDFLDVRDIIRAYVTLLTCKYSLPSPVYNIASGKEYKIQWILDTLLSYSSARIQVKPDNDKYRAGESFGYGCYEKIKKSFGWEPRISLDKTLQDLLNWWRCQV